ncbi:hypothetical protein RhiLY_04908 [Ceratobasidium sp. AG-Ba]|nr:hypothetical protein RhiLY_04908 [Ceratobasidium sp. AG-Ba]
MSTNGRGPDPRAASTSAQSHPQSLLRPHTGLHDPNGSKKRQSTSAQGTKETDGATRPTSRKVSAIPKQVQTPINQDGGSPAITKGPTAIPHRGNAKRVRHESIPGAGDEEPEASIPSQAAATNPEATLAGRLTEDEAREATPIKEELDNLLKSREEIATDSREAQLMARLKKAEIGSAFIRGCGPGHVRNIIDLNDPKSKLNPRKYNPIHGHRLYTDMFVKGRKLDHRAPIAFVGPRSALSEGLRLRMKQGDAGDLTWTPPLLQLDHPNVKKIDFLEGLLWLGKLENGTPMSQEKREEIQANLEELCKALPCVHQQNSHFYLWYQPSHS